MRPVFEIRTYGLSIPITVFSDQGFDFMAHWHPDVEIICVLEGSIRIGINKECRLLKNGDFAICTSNDIHYYDTRDLTSKLLILIFHPKLIGSASEWPRSTALRSSFFDEETLKEVEPDFLATFSSMIKQVSDEIQHRKIYYEQIITGKMIELCAFLLRNLQMSEQESEKVRLKATDYNSIQNALIFMEKNFQRDIALPDAAGAAGLSLFYFTRLFRVYTGMTFKAYLSRIRIMNADSMIRNGTSSMTDIAYECGFNSIRTFNRVYRDIKGYTPSYYLKDSADLTGGDR